VQKSFQSLEQRLTQTSVDLLNQMAEIQTLKQLIQIAESSRHCRDERATDWSVTRYSAD
jgi:hypothetical protein